MPPSSAPEFYNSQYHYGTFARLACELQFLCVLTDIAERSNQNPVNFICNIYRTRESSKQPHEGQQSLLQNECCTYDRIILNLTQFPKNNPHHFLLNQIQMKEKELKSSGMMIVLSTKKLFIPSLSDKVEELLKTFKIESVLTFEHLKGRGEIPAYIYVLSKRDKPNHQNLSLSGQIASSAPLRTHGRKSSKTPLP